MTASSRLGSSPLTILLAQHTAALNGSTISGQLVAKGFCQAGWQVVVVLGEDGPGRAAYDELGCLTMATPYRSWFRRGSVLRSGWQIVREILRSGAIARQIRQARADLVYVNTSIGLAAAVAAWRTNTPCVWHIRELFDDVEGEIARPALGGKSLVRRLISACADQVVVISSAVKDNFLGPRWGGPAAVIPNAVDDRFFELQSTRESCRASLGLPQDVPIVGVPGTLRPMKGHEFFFSAAAQIAREAPQCLFAVTGDGTERYTAQLQSHVASLGLTERVLFLGSIRQMPEFYRACDVVCVPSKAEPFGRTVIEAFAVGTPLVASAVGGIVESVTPDVTGRLVDYGNEAGLAQSILELLRDSSLRDRLALAAREQAKQRNSQGAYREQVNAVVELTLRNSQAAAGRG